MASDIRGVAIELGDLVAAATSMGHVPFLRLGRVYGFTHDGKPKLKPEVPTGGCYRPQLKHCIVIEKARPNVL
jgi:hypothetical protein